MSNLWNVVTGTRLQTLIERSSANIVLPLISGVVAEVELISGSIPAGTRLESNTIVGTIYEVAYDTIFNAVFRATLLKDRQQTLCCRLLAELLPK